MITRFIVALGVVVEIVDADGAAEAAAGSRRNGIRWQTYTGVSWWMDGMDFMDRMDVPTGLTRPPRRLRTSLLYAWVQLPGRREPPSGAAD